MGAKTNAPIILDAGIDIAPGGSAPPSTAIRRNSCHIQNKANAGEQEKSER